jgi:hypothetical protein
MIRASPDHPALFGLRPGLHQCASAVSSALMLMWPLETATSIGAGLSGKWIPRGRSPESPERANTGIMTPVTQMSNG